MSTPFPHAAIGAVSYRCAIHTLPVSAVLLDFPTSNTTNSRIKVCPHNSGTHLGNRGQERVHHLGYEQNRAQEQNKQKFWHISESQLKSALPSVRLRW